MNPPSGPREKQGYASPDDPSVGGGYLIPIPPESPWIYLVFELPSASKPFSKKRLPRARILYTVSVRSSFVVLKKLDLEPMNRLTG